MAPDRLRLRGGAAGSKRGVMDVRAPGLAAGRGQVDRGVARQGHGGSQGVCAPQLAIAHCSPSLQMPAGTSECACTRHGNKEMRNAHARMTAQRCLKSGTAKKFCEQRCILMSGLSPSLTERSDSDLISTAGGLQGPVGADLPSDRLSIAEDEFDLQSSILEKRRGPSAARSRALLRGCRRRRCCLSRT